MEHTALLKRGLLLGYLTLGWNVIGVVIVILAAIAARSVALAGFGLDSLIEIFASVVVVWQLTARKQIELWVGKFLAHQMQQSNSNTSAN